MHALGLNRAQLQHAPSTAMTLAEMTQLHQSQPVKGSIDVKYWHDQLEHLTVDCQHCFTDSRHAVRMRLKQGSHAPRGAKARTMAQGVSRRSTSVTFRAFASPFQFIICDAADAQIPVEKRQS